MILCPDPVLLVPVEISQLPWQVLFTSRVCNGRKTRNGIPGEVWACQVSHLAWRENVLCRKTRIFSLRRLDHCFTQFALVDKIEHQRHGWRYGGFHSHGGTPIAGWFVSWKIPMKWMITRGTPIFPETPTGLYSELLCPDFFCRQLIIRSWLPTGHPPGDFWKTGESMDQTLGTSIFAQENLGDTIRTCRLNQARQESGTSTSGTLGHQLSQIRWSFWWWLVGECEVSRAA